MQKKISSVMQRAVDKGETAGMNLLVVKDGKEICYADCGYRNVERKEAFGRDTIMRLYSMSKPVTAAAVMLLVDRGLLDLGEEVSCYIDTFANSVVNTDGKEAAAKRPVMVKDLMNMTSGVPYPGEVTEAERQCAGLFREIDKRLYTEQAMTTMEICRALGKNALNFHPGEHFQYGSSADVLGAVIEVASGRRFGDFLQEELFEPLGMKDTAFYVPEEKQDRLAEAYRCGGGKVQREVTNNLGICYTMERRPAFESGGAGLASTLDDYAHFAAMLMDKGSYQGKQILSETAVQYLTKGKLLPHQQADVWETLNGFTYANLMRIGVEPEMGVGFMVEGEYGWDGWLGPYFANIPEYGLTILMGMQKLDAGTFGLTRKLRNVILGSMD